MGVASNFTQISEWRHSSPGSGTFPHTCKDRYLQHFPYSNNYMGSASIQYSATIARWHKILMWRHYWTILMQKRWWCYLWSTKKWFCKKRFGEDSDLVNLILGCVSISGAAPHLRGTNRELLIGSEQNLWKGLQSTPLITDTLVPRPLSFIEGVSFIEGFWSS